MNYFRFDYQNPYQTAHNNYWSPAITPSSAKGIKQVEQEGSIRGNLLDCRSIFSSTIVDDFLHSISQAVQFLLNGEFKFVRWLSKEKKQIKFIHFRSTLKGGAKTTNLNRVMEDCKHLKKKNSL